jgi:hypothetical protein
VTSDPFVAAVAAGADAPDMEELVRGRGTAGLLASLEALERDRSGESSLYRRVRGCAYASALCRFHLQDDPGLAHGAPVPAAAWRDRLDRRFDRAIAGLWEAVRREGPGRMLLSELGAAYRAALFGDLARQVQASVRASRGNRWMFRCGSLREYPLRLRSVLRTPDPGSGLFPVLEERTPVRLDLTHSGWSDIFFLAMERPDLARVINASVGLAVGRPGAAPTGDPRPPITAMLRVIDEPVLRLTAVDLGETADLTRLDQVFDFAADHLGLLKAAIIASGVVPPAVEGTGQDLGLLLSVLVGPGLGLEVVSQVADIPKGSRLAVSTNLLAGLVSLLMRATGQTAALEGGLSEAERRVVASRAILGEWLGGSGGGWQDSGGIWPGFKAIEGVAPGPGDPEQGVSAGSLLPRHRPIAMDADATRRIMDSLVVFHGGMAGNVGPILELVTEAHLVGWSGARAARRSLVEAFPAIERALMAGDARTLGGLVDGLFHGPLARIIPGVDNAFTTSVVAEARRAFGGRFWGFGMLGGMSGGGMSLWIDPVMRSRAEDVLPTMLAELADRHRATMPFAITPVLMRARLEDGTAAVLHRGLRAVLMPGYYRIHAPLLARLRHDGLTPRRRADLLNHLERTPTADQSDLLRGMVVNLLPDPVRSVPASAVRMERMLSEFGFDGERQEVLQARCRAGRIGVARNRLPPETVIRDPGPGAVRDPDADPVRLAEARSLIAAGGVAEVILAGGLGSRWSGGAGVVKALNPFIRLGGGWRSFLELHLRRRAREGAHPVLLTTSFMTAEPIRTWLSDLARGEPSLAAGVYLSKGQGVSRRIVPTQADLRCWLADQPRARLDSQAEKARQAVERAWSAWAAEEGEASPYADQDPGQCLNPPGHWWELPSALINGELARLLADHPTVHHLCLHNVDVLGVGISPGHLAAHLAAGAALTAEVIPRLSGDAGGSLAEVDGHLRIVEGLAIPDETQELGLAWYNSNTWWVDIDRWLRVFDLVRSDLADRQRVVAAVRRVSLQLPTYVTLKLAKRRWGRGHEDQLPVAQFEQLWSDFAAVKDCPCAFVSADRQRGQQLKEVGQVPAWIRDGSCAAVAAAAGLDPV